MSLLPLYIELRPIAACCTASDYSLGVYHCAAALPPAAKNAKALWPFVIVIEYPNKMYKPNTKRCTYVLALLPLAPDSIVAKPAASNTKIVAVGLAGAYNNLLRIVVTLKSADSMTD